MPLRKPMNTNRGLKLIYSKNITFFLLVFVIGVKKVRSIEWEYHNFYQCLATAQRQQIFSDHLVGAGGFWIMINNYKTFRGNFSNPI